MIAHVSVNVSDYNKSTEFYKKALEPLGYELKMELKEWNVAGFGDTHPDFWLHAEGANQPTHVAFAAKDRKQVEDFYNAAIAAGGRDNGKPEYQIEYSPGYFGAFVFDLDGNNIEAVWMDPSKE